MRIVAVCRGAALQAGMLWVWLHCHNSSGRNMTLGLNQPLTETSTSDIS